MIKWTLNKYIHNPILHPYPIAGLETSGDTPERSRRGHQNEIEEAAVQRDMEAFGPTWVKLKPDDIEEVSRL